MGGMMVGAFEWASYEEGRTQLEPGDVLVIYSDGITEAESAEDEEYDEQRLIELLLKERYASAHEIRAAIFSDVDAWSGQRERSDDQTLVVIKAEA
jgi:sigma-B regulation protein RsbU (phosphoserine phosphatase)